MQIIGAMAVMVIYVFSIFVSEKRKKMLYLHNFHQG